MAAALREARLRARRTPRSRARVADGQPIGRPHLAEAVLAAPANAARLQAEQIDDVGSLIRAYLIEGRPAFRLRQTPTVARGGRRDPRRRRRRRLGAPLLGHRRRRRGARQHRPLPRARHRRRRGLLRHAHARADRAAGPPLRELDLLTTGSADFHGPDNRLFSRFLAFETYGLEPNLGPIAQLAASSASRR